MWISVVDSPDVRTSGDWQVFSYRYAEKSSLASVVDGAALTVDVEGETVVLRMGQQNIPVLKSSTFGRVSVEVDGATVADVDPVSDALEVIVARGLPEGRHTLRLVHRGNGDRAGCLIEQIGVFAADVGEVGFAVVGEEQAYLVDARVTVERHGETVRSSLSRNWRSGRCRLAGLPAGDTYRLRVEAMGWDAWTSDEFTVRAGEETDLGSVVLSRARATRLQRVRFPAFGRPAIVARTASFKTRFLGYGASIEGVRISRSVGPATLTRTLHFEEQRDRAFYYDRELVATVPEEVPPGMYDLWVDLDPEEGRPRVCRSPRSVYVSRRSLGEDPVFMTWGHLDTWGQYQAEYLSRMVEMANLLGANMVLISNATNPAYLTGVLAGLDLPYTVTFGNHQYHGHEKWFGHPVHRVDFGDVSILNFGMAWHEDFALADKLLAESDASVKVINGFEANAPVEFLDRHRVSFIHDAHGPGEKVLSFGATPTQRAGKINAESFRLVRFKEGRVVSCTYGGDAEAPIPLPRVGESPIRIEWEGSNDGTETVVRACVANDLLEDYPGCRLNFVVPRGEYGMEGGRMVGSWDSDDGCYTVVEANFELPASSAVEVGVVPQ